jgi:hypothetical protein
MSWWMGLPQGQRYPDLYDEFMARKDGILARSVKLVARMDKLGVFVIGHLGKERLAAAVTFDPHNLLPVTIERLAYLRATIEQHRQQGVAGRPRELGIM